ncbi:methyltransferase family protein [Aequorivita echinoideorum]|uniref:Isoprenylcysteine carboxylmethyltransferase family protein n=1 Tax=Aequorivita echinoideorum TaxID=1549647 RepID=A0ABS5S0K0_9FLAO|nr:isoprenylcysteine carboxylmethyltransferase family protein [Aequorivita echinoideorum]MBT0606737.1 isoprenylcysteine carboxylmethyltransferase family protein [Aequorivita echinoideorum]
MNVPKSSKDYLFVGIQLLLFAAYILKIRLVPMNLPEWLRYSGLVIVGLGVVLGLVALLQINTKLSPFPTPVANSTLITNGAFAIARHPIYTALISSGLGYALYRESLYKMLIVLLLSILFYFKSKYEEQLLLQKFPSYQNYKKRTRRFI